MRIAHIINPVIVNESSDLFVAQPITFETMRIAQQFARGHVDVALYSAQYPEDRPIIPEWFQMTPDLDRSIFDIGSFYEKRKLPIVKDLLNRLYDASDAEYFIYTNVDIALMPQFYLSVKMLIDDGYDAFSINRRTISNTYSGVDQIFLMFSQIGEKHPGHDCFVFKRSLYTQFDIGTACIGADWVGRLFISNMICHAENFKIFKDLHLTFHLGDNRNWKVTGYNDYNNHNMKELNRLLLKYKSIGLLKSKPLVHKFLHQIKSSKTESAPPTSPPGKLSNFKKKLRWFLFKSA